MRTLDLSPFYRSTIGFDRLARLLDAAPQPDRGPTYPPYNIERVSDDEYRISMAVAGFGEEDINIEVKDNGLTISGEIVQKESDKQFLHQGIAERNFERRFQLADHVIVKGAQLENGLLHVELVREIPEEKRARRIAISSNAKKSLEAA